MDDRNKIHKSMKYTLEKEENQTLNYLDLKPQRQKEKITVGVYHKPTQTDITIRNTSNRPTKHKQTAYNDMVHRINTLPITPSVKINRMKTIARNNGYQRPEAKLRVNETRNVAIENYNRPSTGNDNHQIKWSKFTYFGPQIRTLPKLFKHTNM
jgi:hypothetical protein